MKIKGPGGPTEPQAVEDASPAKVAGEKFVEKLSGPKVARPADPIGAIASELKAGTLTPTQAAEKMLDLVMSQGPAASLPDSLRANLRAELTELLQNDPNLATRAKRARLV